jgi:methionine-rich copper-binding protein CopC
MILRISTLIIGLALLVFAISDLLVPRARFLRATPAAGSTLTEVPSFVILSFSSKLAPESSMEVTSTIKLLPNGESEYLDGSSVVKSSGLNSADTSGQSMRAELRPGMYKGLYLVSWRTTAAGWRTGTYGNTYFTVGMSAPESIKAGMTGNFSEHNYQWRGRRATLTGGLIMILLAFYLWKKNSA